MKPSGRLRLSETSPDRYISETRENSWSHRAGEPVLAAGSIILVLKIAVVAVTLLLIASLVALARGNYRLHGRINLAFFFLTLAALVGLEVVARIWSPTLFSDFFEAHQAHTALTVHLSFSLPAAVLLPFMLATGLRRRRNWHVGLGVVFLVLWTGTFITGVFFLPHIEP
jgi:uncharacterized membrane protein YozB (DUF420 family)